MKYIKKINLIDTSDNINLKKIIEETYHKGENYYKEIEVKQNSHDNINYKKQ